MQAAFCCRLPSESRYQVEEKLFCSGAVCLARVHSNLAQAHGEAAAQDLDEIRGDTG